MKDLFELKEQALDEAIKEIAVEYNINSERLKQMLEEKQAG